MREKIVEMIKLCDANERLRVLTWKFGKMGSIRHCLQVHIRGRFTDIYRAGFQLNRRQVRGLVRVLLKWIIQTEKKG